MVETTEKQKLEAVANTIVEGRTALDILRKMGLSVDDVAQKKGVDPRGGVLFSGRQVGFLGRKVEVAGSRLSESIAETYVSAMQAAQDLAEKILSVLEAAMVAGAEPEDPCVPVPYFDEHRCQLCRG